MYGAGNIGRGFVGLTFSLAGYEVVFVDVQPEVIEALNREQKYPVCLVDNDGEQTVWSGKVRAVDGRDIEAVAQEIATCDLMATAVGVNVLPRIVPVLVAGLRRRWSVPGAAPFDIIICENLLNADQYLRDLLGKALTPGERDRLSAEVGLVEASIGRMVPVMTAEQKAGNPLLVRAEPYDRLPVDKAAFRGPLPAIGNLVPYSPFSYYIERKLFVHNMGHAVCAYLGLHFGHEFTFQAMSDPWIHLCVKNAMFETATALAQAYGPDVTMKQLAEHVDDLVYRFQNRALLDTNERVGADPARKLSRHDRLVGAALFAGEQGVLAVHLGLGIAAGCVRAKNLGLDHLGAHEVLCTAAGLDPTHALVTAVESFGAAINSGCSAQQLFQLAQQLVHSAGTT